MFIIVIEFQLKINWSIFFSSVYLFNFKKLFNLILSYNHNQINKYKNCCLSVIIIYLV